MSNPTQYKSIYPELTPALYKLSYDRATPDKHGNFYVLNYYANRYDYIEKFRIFIPPGTWSINFSILEWNGVSGVVRYKKPPTTQGVLIPGITLDKVTSQDIAFKGLEAGQSNGRTGLLYGPTGTITEENCGWYYVKVNGDPGGPCYYNSLQLEVKADIYNAWYDTINWDRDIESVEVYGGASSGTTLIPVTTGVGLVGDPNPLDFRQTSVSSTNNVLRFILRNTGTTDITINSITFPDGFTWKFTDEYPAYQPYDFDSVYQWGLKGQKGFKDIVIENRLYWFNDHIVNSDRSNLLIKVYVPFGAFVFKCNINIGNAGVESTFAVASFGKPPTQFYKDAETGLSEDMFYFARKPVSGFDDLEYKILIPDINGDIEVVLNEFYPDQPLFESNKKLYSGKWLYIIVVSKTTSAYINYAWINHQLESVSDLTSIYTSGWLSNGDPPDVLITSPATTMSKNPTIYENMCDPYYRAVENQLFYDTEKKVTTISKIFGFDLSPDVRGPQTGEAKYQSHARIFVPPGTTSIRISYGKSVMADASISRFLQPPVSDDFLKVSCIAWLTPEDRKKNKPVTCDEFSEKYTTYTADGNIIPARSNMGGGFETSITGVESMNIDSLDKCKTDLFNWNRGGSNWVVVNINLTTPLPVSQSGWFYVKMNGPFLGESGDINRRWQHNNSTSIIVDPETYNQWWDHGGSNTDNSINWDKDVDSCEVYKPLPYKPIPKPGVSIMNRTQYKTIHLPYYRLHENTGYKFVPETPGVASTKPPAQTTFTFIVSESILTNGVKTPWIRMFIPPGTVKVECLIRSGMYNDLQALSHYKSPLTTVIPGKTNEYNEIKKPTITDLTLRDFYTRSTKTWDESDYYNPKYVLDANSVLNICYNEFYTSALLTVYDAGWLYSYIDITTYATKTSNQTFVPIFSVEVDIATFNSWWDSYGSNKDKSINWSVDVEGVETYIPKKS